MSGAGRIKGDAVRASDNAYVEIKNPNKSITLNAAEVERWWKQSVHQGNDSCELVIEFVNPPMRIRGTIERRA
jgi:hypothetical protein